MENHVAWIEDKNILSLTHDNAAHLLHAEAQPFIKKCLDGSVISVSISEVTDDNKLFFSSSQELSLGESLELHLAGHVFPVYAGAIVRTDWFDTLYAAPDEKLGAACGKKETTFAVWAPTATELKLYLNNVSYSMNRQKNGVWKCTIPGYWHGSSYQYKVTVNGQTELVNDPYAKSLMPNSTKSVVIDQDKVRINWLPASQRPSLKNVTDAVIYELHLRDATSHKESGVKQKGKYCGLAERNTKTNKGFSTGISYMKELGCTHVQLLPVNDFARVDELDPEKDYNWGYDPLFFQVPEGSYSLSPEDPAARITECKTMINTIHQEGLSVILDVVFNHVYKIEESTFQKLVPGYYFRYHEDGTLSNGTGVGNDFASERTMGRKFIIESIDYWLTEFKVDGFRFDLMGILDIETMKQVRERCEEENVKIIVLGEGWDLSTALPAELKSVTNHSQKLPGIMFFNDFFRDTLKGNLFNMHDTGYTNGKGRFIERLPHLVSGCALEEFGLPVVSDINQTINYVECHDNHTLWDRLLKTNEEESDKDRKKIHQLATGLTLLSQGVPFIHAGQEWFRSKQGDGNSYLSGDKINQLDWSMRETEEENIKFIRNLISIRKQFNVFRLSSKEEVRRRLHILQTPAPVFGFALFGDREDFVIYVNPTKRRFELHLPSPGKWRVMATNEFPGDTELAGKEVSGEFTFLEPYELTVMKKAR
ncbi:type I pullulanase [Evansella sp. LMS18]|uniref:type I pullulanase n=1 Tax=Evansella sp. LMS18 TaxID=2924033 RepID=UPI0020D019B1|nr:type I pullulanase [Evansella sp. LMS18]UTR10632.1 type I pullulanase [Evansella sp. LMS18]